MIVHAIHQMRKKPRNNGRTFIDPDYLRRLIVKVRSFMGKEETDIPDEGSNPIDDEVPLGALQDEEDDLSREEVVEEIQGADPPPTGRARSADVAWPRRRRAGGVERASCSRHRTPRGPTENYLLDHPLLAEHWLDGMERLGLGGLVADAD
jgi:hypothetical protein